MTDQIQPPSLDQLRDPTKLTRWTIRLLYAQISFTGIAWAALLIMYVLLLNLPNSGAHTFVSTLAELQMADQSRRIITLVQAIILIASAVLILKWIYRMNHNAHQLGAQGMESSPKASVVWFFVPFINIYMPYFVMREIWKTSKNPADWKMFPPRRSSWRGGCFSLPATSWPTSAKRRKNLHKVPVNSWMAWITHRFTCS